MSSNFYARFKSIFPDPPLLIGTVTEYGSGFAVVALPGGGTLRVRGTAQVGDQVFVRDGVIEGDAPLLTPVTIDI